MNDESLSDTDSLKLENQLCFPLYACSKEVVRTYKPYLDAVGLTYTQYIVMMVLWEHGTINVKRLGEFLYLDSGTLTPLLKKMESQGFITRARAAADERNLLVSLTGKGAALKRQAAAIPDRMRQCLNLTGEEAATLYRLLYKLLGQMPGSPGAAVEP